MYDNIFLISINNKKHFLIDCSKIERYIQFTLKNEK